MSMDPEAEEPMPTAPAAPMMPEAMPAMAGLQARLSTRHGMEPKMAGARAKSILKAALGKARQHPAMSRTKIM